MKQNREVLEKYYCWLCDLILVDRPGKSYLNLAKQLHTKRFEWFVPNDDNRAFEARDLRNNFGIVFKNDEPPVSMLEVIISLAYRCEDFIGDDNLCMCDCFWMLIKNAGLDKFDDEHYFELCGPVEIDNILTKIIQRTYARDGKGGLFPLKHSKKDQRKIELWYQMSEYLVENYF